jgi:hypothetical protein
VYVTNVDGQKLTFCVSGQLWNRSLVMMDVETESLWSHLLGRGMEGRHKGTVLNTIPSDITTWAVWKAEHPETSVLNLQRSSRQFIKDFYKQPGRFVVGFVGNFGMCHVSMEQLLEQPVANVDARGLPLLVAFDPEGTATRVFRRKLDDRMLTFSANVSGKLVDDQTGSTWNRGGVAVAGLLKGKTMEQQVSIPSFRRAWLNFHPDSRLIDLAPSPGGKK